MSRAACARSRCSWFCSLAAVYEGDYDAHAVTAGADGGAMEYYMGPIDYGSHVTITATVGGKTATIDAGATVFSID